MVRSFPRRDSVVTDKWEGDDEDLPTVRRVCDGLGIAHHPRLEDELSGNALGSPEAVALVYDTIFELEANEAPVVVSTTGKTRRRWRENLRGHRRGV